MPASILIIDDDPVQRRLLQAAVTRFGYEAVTAEDGEKGLAVFAARPIALAILDLVMPGIDGLTVLKTLRERGVAVPVIVQTAQGGIDTVIGAMRAGAFDFVVKPVSPERLRLAIESALKVERREEQVRKAQPRGAGSLTVDDLVTASPSMRGVIALARKASASNIPILIEGESGVGKEIIARAIQGSSGRSERPFVTVNCGAIPDNLVESILFGHEKGSFTGATEKHDGKFVEASGGTLFLDEVGDLPLEAQVKLLRAVQEGEVDPVGARASRKVDIRLISATHRDLSECVGEGRFRQDLFYRLNVFPIAVPPLRERREDIEALALLFARRFSLAERGGRAMTVAPAAIALLKAYDWPGNIRQLENAVFRAVVLAERDVLTADEFPQIRAQVEGVDLTSFSPPELAAADPVEGPKIVESAQSADDAVRAIDARGHVRALAEVELEMIQFALERYAGQMSEVARRLGIGRSTLYRKLKEHGIDPDETRPERLAS